MAAVAVGLMLVGIEATPGAAAGNPYDEWWSLSNLKATPDGYALYLAVYGNMGAPLGTPVVVKRFDGQGNQQWRFERQSDDTVIVRSGGTQAQQALSIEGNSHTNGTRVLQYTYQPSNRYQRWHILEDKRNETTTPSKWGIVRLRNVATNKCLGVAGGTAQSLPPLSQAVIWDCSSGADQRWWLDLVFPP